MATLRRIDRSLLLVLGVLGAATIAPYHAAAHVAQVKEVPPRPVAPVDGRENFAAYCASCHGRDARGNGPAAPALKGPVPDLTTIARRNGGTFDAVAIERAISGSDRVRPAHGSLDMPIWGPVFRSAQGDAATSVRLVNLVKFLESVQQK